MSKEIKTIEVPAYRDSKGNPCCAQDFKTGEVCPFYYPTGAFGTHETCAFAKRDSTYVKGVVGLERRGHDGAGTLIPSDTCPIWGDTTKPIRSIIGIVGPKNSGKSEAAKYIANSKGYTVKSIATPIKQILSIIGIPNKNLFGTNEDKNELLPGFNTTARKLLQYTGTEFGRDSLHKDVWIDILIKNLDPNTSYVIDDVRFINEAKKIKALGGILIGLSRPWMSWEDQGVDNHTSEICAYAEPFKSMIDHWVGNNGTKEELHNNIAKIVNVSSETGKYDT